jgi:hypothetical protein
VGRLDDEDISRSDRVERFSKKTESSLVPAVVKAKVDRVLRNAMGIQTRLCRLSFSDNSVATTPRLSKDIITIVHAELR